jgi:hypothetical protein
MKVGKADVVDDSWSFGPPVIKFPHAGNTDEYKQAELLSIHLHVPQHAAESGTDDHVEQLIP